MSSDEEAVEESTEAESAVDSDFLEDDDDGLPEGPGFMALYTTLMLLLMTFFIVLVSMGSNSSSKERFEEGRKSIQATFSVMGLSSSKQVLLFMQSALKLKHAAIQDSLDLLDVGPKDYEEKKKKKKGSEFLDDDPEVAKKKANQLNRLISLGFNIDSYSQEDEFLKVKFPVKDVFDKGTADFIPVFQYALNSFLNLVGDEYLRMEINVYTNEKPLVRLPMTSSLELAALRAHTIAEKIRILQGPTAGELVPIGFGNMYSKVRNKMKPEYELIELKIYQMWGYHKIKKSQNLNPLAIKVDEIEEAPLPEDRIDVSEGAADQFVGDE